MPVFLHSERKKSGSAALPPYLVAIKWQMQVFLRPYRRKSCRCSSTCHGGHITNREPANVGGINRGKAANGAFTVFVVATAANAAVPPRVYQNLTLPSCGRPVPS
ncbi:hypothetical protein AAC387_Pa03g2893 [Persea americana]